jgi:hypothetical protein
MADAGALRGPAIAGHAGAVVEHVGHVQLHVVCSPRRDGPTSERRDSRIARYNLFLSLGVPDTETRERASGWTILRFSINLRDGDPKAARTAAHGFLYSKLCETAIWWLILWGNTLRAFGNPLETRRESRPRERMTSWVIRNRPIAVERLANAPVPCRDAR